MRYVFVLFSFLLFSCVESEVSHPKNGSVDSIIPVVQELYSGELSFYSSGDLRIEGLELLGESAEVVKAWIAKSGLEIEEGINANLIFKKVTSIEGSESDEAYELDIDSDKIIIASTSEVGLFRGFYTLKQIMPASAEIGGLSGGVYLPKVRIVDYPEFEHRGLLLDCCRHFMEVDFVKKMIDNLAEHKMNVLHWHLTEDQGWRVEIDAYPMLTEVGAWRTELDGSRYGGYYTKAEIREVVKYASERHVEVIPEIELPGHSQAALASYPWLGCTGEKVEVANKWGVFKDIYCAGNDSTLEFIETVMDEVCELFPSNRIHIGGDEAPKVRWKTCDKCQKRIHNEGLRDEHELQTWMIEYVGEYLSKKGKTIIGWDEILEGGLPIGAAVQSWRGMAGALEAVEHGVDAIVSPTSHCYLDYPLSSTDLEEVYSFDPIPEGAEEGPGRIIGGECNMWTEHAPQELVESKVFPRAIGLAEVLWSGVDKTGEEGAYEEFLNRLELHLNRLDFMDVDYGLEAVPVSLSLAMKAEGGLMATIVPEASYIKGIADFRGRSVELGQDLLIDGPGDIEVSINYRGRYLERKEKFSVDGHAAVYKPIKLNYELSPYYTGGGEHALVDGKVGSNNFRDGVWQAKQARDLVVEVDLEGSVKIDSISINVYLYQDAWIFEPSKVRFEVWSEELGYVTVSEIDNAMTLDKNDFQGIVNVSSGKLENVEGAKVRLSVENPGVCPEWHAAATEPTWMFLDELVVRERN